MPRGTSPLPVVGVIPEYPESKRFRMPPRRFARATRTSAAVLGAVGAALAVQLVGLNANAAVTPAFTVSAAPANLPNANNAGEPSIGVDWKTGNVMYQAYTSTYRISP